MIVPLVLLSRRAVEILDEARTLGNTGLLVFPAPGGGPLDASGCAGC